MVARPAVPKAAVDPDTLAHECGHAVAAWLSHIVVRVDTIDFRPASRRIGWVQYQTRRQHPDDGAELAVIALAGAAGANVVLGKCRSGGLRDDLAQARKAIEAFLKVKGPDALRRRWTEEQLADSSLDIGAMFHPSRCPSRDVVEGLNLCYRRAKRILLDNRPAFERLMGLCRTGGLITPEGIASQFGPRPWAPR